MRWPFAVVVISLLCLVAAPFIMERRTRELWNDVVNVADPARALTTEIQLAFTLETGDTRSYILTAEPSDSSDHRRARARRYRAEAQLLPLARELGPAVLQLSQELHAQLTPIDLLRDSLYDGLIPRQTYAERIVGQRERFSTAIATAGRLDQAIAAAAARTRSQIQATQRASMAVDALLVVVGLLAAMIAAEAGRRQHALAIRLDRRERWQSAFGDAARRLNASATASDVMRTLVTTGVDATSADGFIVELGRASAAQGDVEVAVRLSSGELLEQRVPYDASATRALGDTPAPEPAAAADARVVPAAVPSYVPLSVRRESPRALAVRIDGNAGVRATLVLLRGQDDERRSNADASYLRALGDLATAALQRVQLLDALRESEERFRQIAENIRENVWLADAQYSTVFYVNSAYSVIWGRSKESLYADPWSLLEGVHPEDRARVAAALSELKDGQFDIEYRVVRPTGEVRWVWARGFPVTNERGEIFRIAGITEDITERKRIAESRVRLVRGFTHDVKNPLGAADGFLALLEDRMMGELQPRQLDAVTRARRSIQRALDLIRNVLELARAEAGQVEVHPESMSPAAAARDIVDEFRAQAGEKGLSLDLVTPDELPPIESDASRVRQILSNLVSNAVKYTPRGGRIEVAACVKSDGDAPHVGRWVAIDVCDDGPGISAEQRHRLFEEFTRFDPNAAQGAGIGLAISQRLAAALGGSITVRSEVGAGSTFTLWLPVS